MSTLLSTLILAATLGTASTEANHAPDADELARIGTTNRYHFEDDFVEGEVLAPTGSLIQSRGQGKHPSLIAIRTHFIDRLYRHALDM